MVKTTPNNLVHPLKHIAIIMDGNNRWAKQRGLSGIAGHRAGVERIREILPAARDHGVDTVSLFAFSSENWRRPAMEVRGLMSLFSTYLKKEAKTLRDDNIRLKVVGNRKQFSDRLNRLITDAETLTKAGALNLILYVDYGGRWDIVQVAQQLAAEVKAGTLRPSDITENSFDRCLYQDGISAPDLCIRTAGEQRISNFMLWQMAYTEFYFTDCYWPDFDNNALEHAITDYCQRQRRFGARSTASELDHSAGQTSSEGTDA
ncbi:MAG: polyprenyl diphosphate synthase [Porticoccaceae bacterium]|nr:polyprenyl diphosphate synthase [Porticoccaceae bacterium]